MDNQQTHQDYVIRECMNTDCRFRFPAPAAMEKVKRCPKCKADTIVVHPIPLNPDTESRTNPPSNFHLEMVLDNIRSTFNVGAMFRTADGAGISKIHLTGITPPPDHPKVHKTALGAENSVPYQIHNNCLEAVKALKEQGFTIYALEKTNRSIPIETISLEENHPTAVVVGNEIVGVDPDVLDMCDQHLHIPMNGIKGSLNVAIAYGIAVYHFLLKN